MAQNKKEQIAKRILLVSHHFFPEINPRAFRATELCRELIRHGHIVDIIYTDHKLILRSGEIRQYLDESSAFTQNTLSVRGEADDSLYKRLFRFFIAEKFILTRLPWLKRVLVLTGYDAVLSIGTPFYVHMAVAKALRRTPRHIASVCDNGDPFYNYKAHDKAFYFGLIQRWTFSAFDFVCTPIDSAVDYYSKYVSRSKIRVVPQGYDMNDISTADYKKRDVPTFAFAGRFYMDIRNPESLLSFLVELETPFQFIIFAPNTGLVYNEVLEPYKRKLGDRLILQEMIPRRKCIYELSKADFLINLENTLSVQSPSKVVDYALSSRPIISFSQNNIPKEQLKRWIAGDYINPLPIDTSAYDIRNICTQFEEMLRLEQSL